jgi:hypothetical protein
MTQDDLDNGCLICLIGVALVKPAEFVIFRFSQRTLEAEAALGSRLVGSEADFDRYIAEHNMSEEELLEAFARWIAEQTGGPVPRFVKVEPGDEQILEDGSSANWTEYPRSWRCALDALAVSRRGRPSSRASGRLTKSSSAAAQ